MARFSRKIIQRPSLLSDETILFRDNLTTTLKESNMLTSLDNQMFNLIIDTFDIYIKANDILQREGLVIESARGNKMPHPAYKIRDDCAKQLDKLLDKFGLSPKARRELARPKEKEHSESEIQKFLKESKKKVNAEIQNN